MVVLIVVVDVNLLRRGAGPKPVHLEVVVAPRVDGLDELREMRLDLRMRQIERSAAPVRFVGFAVVAFHEPVLPVFVFRVLMVASEGHEPDAGGQAKPLDLFRHGLHSMRIGSVGLHAVEAATRPIKTTAILPLVINLDHPETKRLEFFRNEQCQLNDGLLVSGPSVLVVIPGAVAGNLRAELDLGNAVRSRRRTTPSRRAHRRNSRWPAFPVAPSSQTGCGGVHNRSAP